jgi:hypothetical protein
MLPNRFVRWMFVCLAFVLAVAPVATASAQGKPVKQPFPFGPPQTISVCGFDVLLESTMDKGHMMTSTKDGVTRSILNGVLKLTATNTVNGKSIDWVNPAQCTFVNYSDGSGSTTCHGPSSLYGMPDLPLPAFAFIKGTVSFSWDATGELTDYKVVGTVLDVCAALQ